MVTRLLCHCWVTDWLSDRKARNLLEERESTEKKQRVDKKTELKFPKILKTSHSFSVIKEERFT